MASIFSKEYWTPKNPNFNPKAAAKGVFDFEFTNNPFVKSGKSALGYDVGEQNRKSAEELKSLSDEQRGAYQGILGEVRGETGASRSVATQAQNDLMGGRSARERFGSTASTWGLDDANSTMTGLANTDSRAAILAGTGSGAVGTAAQALSGAGPGFSEQLAQQRMSGGLDSTSRLMLDEGNKEAANRASALGNTRSGATLQALGQVERGVIADNNKRNEALFQGADAARNSRLLSALTGAKDSESILSDRANDADKTELDRAKDAYNATHDTVDLKRIIAGDADAGKNDRYTTAHDLAFKNDALMADATAQLRSKAEENRLNLLLGKTAAQNAAATADQQANKNLWDTGIKLATGL